MRHRHGESVSKKRRAINGSWPKMKRNMANQRNESAASAAAAAA
jgi:hypothetical protein